MVGEDTQVLDQCTRGIIDQVEQLKNMVNEFFAIRQNAYGQTCA